MVGHLLFFEVFYFIFIFTLPFPLKGSKVAYMIKRQDKANNKEYTDTKKEQTDTS